MVCLCNVDAFPVMLAFVEHKYVYLLTHLLACLLNRLSTDTWPREGWHSITGPIAVTRFGSRCRKLL